MKLSTMKDLKINPEANKMEIGWNNCLRISKHEAIKWLKLSDYDLYEFGYGQSGNSDDLRNWIKHFFNITDEDLK